MRYLLAGVAMVVAFWSFTVQMSMTTHVTIVAVCAPFVWWADVFSRPYSPCKHCDKGRNWDATHTHFGEGCAGGPLRIGSCGGAGKKLRWELKLLRLIGIGRSLPDPVAVRRAQT
jgi:hypothetical protein